MRFKNFTTAPTHGNRPGTSLTHLRGVIAPHLGAEGFCKVFPAFCKAVKTGEVNA